MTYEQSKYMNGDENANASFAPKTKPQSQGGNNLTYEQSKYNDEYQKRNNVAQEGINARQQQVLSEKIPDGSQNTMNRIGGAIKNGWGKVKGVFDKDNDNGNSIVDTNGDTTDTSGNQDYTSNIGKREKDLYQNVEDNTQDSLTTLEGQGQDVKSKIENVVPRYDKKTWKSLMTDPNLSWDQKAELVLDALASGGKALTSGQVQQTDKRAINDVITQQYAENIADRDKRAMNAAIEPIEAANKQYTDLELRMRDTVAGAYIDRYKAAQDATTKQEVLKQLIDDSEVWTSLTPKQKIDMLSYIQALDGNGSLLGMAIQMYAPQLFDKFDEWIKSGKNPQDFKFEEDLETGNTEFYNTPLIEVEGGTPFTVKNAMENYMNNPQGLLDYINTLGLDPATTLDSMKTKLQDAYTNDAAGEASVADYSTMINTINKAKKSLPKHEKQPKPTVTEEETQLSNSTDVNETIDNVRRQVDNKQMSYTQAMKELNGLKEKASNMTDNPVVQKKYTDTIAEYSKGAVREGVKSVSEGKDLTGEQRLKKLEQLTEEYANVIANDKDLKREVDTQVMTAERMRDYIEPYTSAVQSSLGSSLYYSGGKKVHETTLDNNGNIVIGKNAFAPDTYNFRNGDKTEAKSILDYVVSALKPENIKKYMDTTNMTDREKKSILANTPVYKLMSKLINNQALSKSKDKDVIDKYKDLKDVYSHWNNIR